MCIVYIETIKDAVFAFGATAETPVAKMKFIPFMTSDFSDNRERHFSAPSHICRKVRSSLLKSWDESTMCNLCPSERRMRDRLCEDTSKVSRLAKSSTFTGRNTSSTLNECSEKRWRAHLSTWAFPLARCLSLDWSWTDSKKFLECKAKSQQGQIKVEGIEEVQE